MEKGVEKATPCRSKKVLAINSVTADNFHVLIFDFDCIEYPYVLKALSKTQAIRGLGTIYIIKSSNGYNAICLDKFPLNEAFDIKLHTFWSDFQHTKIGYDNGNWRMRIGKDKKYMRNLAPCNTWKKRTQSLAHKKFLQLHFGLHDMLFHGDFDNNGDARYDSYIRHCLETNRSKSVKAHIRCSRRR